MCRSWATLRLKLWVASKFDGPFSGWVSKGFWVTPDATAPVEPVPPLPTTRLVLSMRFAPGVAGLNAGTAMAHCAGERRLQRVIGGVRVGDDDVLHAEAADDVALRCRTGCGARTPGTRRDTHWENCSAAAFPPRCRRRRHRPPGCRTYAPRPASRCRAWRCRSSGRCR